MKKTRFIKSKKGIKNRLPAIVLPAAVFVLTMVLALPELAAPSDQQAVINHKISFI